MEVVETLEFLLGTWRIERQIDDHQSSVRGCFEGTATVDLDHSNQNSLVGERGLYTEVGQLSWGSYTGLATRTLEYLVRMNAGVAVNFANGLAFADLDLRSGSWKSRHLCRDDRYEISTEVLSDHVVEEHWRVVGPAKNYEAATTLTRIP